MDFFFRAIVLLTPFIFGVVLGIIICILLSPSKQIGTLICLSSGVIVAAFFSKKIDAEK
jgi:hypothetical protein